MELLSNKALSNLSDGNDLLGTKPKSDIIQFFIENKLFLFSIYFDEKSN